MINIRELLLNLLLVVVGLIWIIGVDYYPILKVLGFPMYLGAIIIWINYSNTYKRIARWMDECMDTNYNEE